MADLSDGAMSSVGDKPGHWCNRTVLGAGVTSAFGDLTYETTNVILPGFLAVLGLPAAVLGVIEGVADGVSSITKIAAGYLADRLGMRKGLVVLGYSLTALMQVFMALAGGWVLILVGRLVGWLGRGLRSPLRDAILAEAVTPATRGRAFGFHRAADTLGAVLGPILGVALLGWVQTLPLDTDADAYRIIFALTLIPGVLSVLSFAWLVRDERLLPNPHLRLGVALQSLPKGYRRFLVAVGLFGMGDFAATLLIAAATASLAAERGLVAAAQWAGGLYVLRNLIQTAASYPAGWLADRFGHRRVLVVGYGLGATTAALVPLAFSRPAADLPLWAAIFTLAGLYAAVQEALESTVAAEILPRELRNVGFGMLGVVNGLGDLVSSATVGLLWTAISPLAGFAFAAVLMTIGTIDLAILSLPESNDNPTHAPPMDDASPGERAG